MGTPKVDSYQQEFSRDMIDISKWWDKNNARSFIEWKLIIDNSKNGSIIKLDGRELNLGRIVPDHESFLKELMNTLIIERSVCEARMYLLAECKAQVASKWIMPLYSWPDIEFNTSAWRPDVWIMRYEFLQQIFGKEAVRDIADKIVAFVNTLPKWYIPLDIIELAPTEKK